MGAEMSLTQLLDLSMTIGRRLLESGAETYRVEETIQRICTAYQADSVDVYAVPTSIITTVVRSGEFPLTRACRIRTRGINLDKVEQLNTLSREICAISHNYHDIIKQLNEIEHSAIYGKWAIRISFGVISAFFTRLFGGEFSCASVAFLIGILLRCAMDGFIKAQVNDLFIDIAGGALISTGAILSVWVNFTNSYSTIIIGSIMTLVPGMAITNSMRDLIAGDFLAGITKFAEAFMIGSGIAVGVAIPLSLARLWGVV